MRGSDSQPVSGRIMRGNNMKCPVILNTTEKLSLCTYMTNSESKVSHTHIHIVFKVGGLGYLILASRLEAPRVEPVFTKYWITVL